MIGDVCRILLSQETLLKVPDSWLGLSRHYSEKIKFSSEVYEPESKLSLSGLFSILDRCELHPELKLVLGCLKYVLILCISYLILIEVIF